MRPFAYVAPQHLQSAVEILQETEGTLFAGGTDLLTEIKDGRATPDLLIHLQAARLPELASITETPAGGLLVGALVTLAELTRNETICRRYPALAEAAASAATPQLRNAATIGGNLRQRTRCEYYRHKLPCLLLGDDTCGARAGDASHHAIFGNAACISGHPSDPATALLALDALITLQSPAGKRTMSLDEFYTLPRAPFFRFDVVEPEELVTMLELPPPPACQGYSKAMDRATWAFALASLAYSLNWEGDRIRQVRLTAAGVAPIPWRLREVEEVMNGQAVSDDLYERAVTALRQAAQPSPSNAYKVDLLAGLLHQAFGQILKGK